MTTRRALPPVIALAIAGGLLAGWLVAPDHERPAVEVVASPRADAPSSSDRERSTPTTRAPNGSVVASGVEAAQRYLHAVSEADAEASDARRALLATNIADLTESARQADADGFPERADLMRHRVRELERLQAAERP